MLLTLCGAAGLGAAAYLNSQHNSPRFPPILPPSITPNLPHGEALRPNLQPTPCPASTKIKKYSEKYLGTLQKILIYPLDGCYPKEVNEARCSESGLQWGDLVDRAYVAYRKVHDTNYAVLNIHQSVIANVSIDILLQQILDHQGADASNESKKVTIQYLGIDMDMEDLGDDIALTASTIFGLTPGAIRIAYCPPKSRLKLTADRTIQFFDACIDDTAENTFPYFCQYTLINSESLRYINKNTGKNIHPSIFRANLVFDGPKFCEDEIFSLRIGKDVNFSGFEPCSHSPWVFANGNSYIRPNHQEPYQYLKRTRTKKDIREPFKDLEFPVFGRNMSISSPGGKIKLGDELWAIIYS